MNERAAGTRRTVLVKLDAGNVLLKEETAIAQIPACFRAFAEMAIIDECQHVEVDTILPAPRNALRDVRMRSAAAGVAAAMIVDRGRSVKTDPNIDRFAVNRSFSDRRHNSANLFTVAPIICTLPCRSFTQ